MKISPPCVSRTEPFGRSQHIFPHSEQGLATRVHLAFNSTSCRAVLDSSSNCRRRPSWTSFSPCLTARSIKPCTRSTCVHERQLLTLVASTHTHTHTHTSTRTRTYTRTRTSTHVNTHKHTRVASHHLPHFVLPGDSLFLPATRRGDRLLRHLLSHAILMCQALRFRPWGLRSRI